MHEALCTHPRELLIDLGKAEGVNWNTVFVEWCSRCGAYRASRNLPKDDKTDWRLPHREQVNDYHSRKESR